MQVSTTYDAIIVGSGPGGSMAAYHLAKSGARVLLLDRARFPRDKSCGDGLIGVSIDLLHDMGLSDLIARAQALKGVQLHTYSERVHLTQSHASQSDGVVIRRRILDAAMLVRAQKAGAEFQDGILVSELHREGIAGCQIVARRNGERLVFTARYVIGADGGRSVIARQAGLFRPQPVATGVARRGYYRVRNAVPEAFHIHVPLPLGEKARQFAGYGWLFPVDKTTVNIGVGLFPAGRLRRFPPLPPLLDDFVAQLQDTANIGEMELIEPAIGGLLPAGGVPSKCHDGSVFLVGDAAGLVDPFTGEGIHAAMRSGVLAARAIDHALKGADSHPANDYGRCIEREFGERIRMGERFLHSYHYASRIIEESAHQHSHIASVVREAIFGLGETTTLSCATATDLPDFTDTFTSVEVGSDRISDQLNQALTRVNPLLRRMATKMIDPALTRNRIATFLAHHAASNGRCTQSDIDAATAVELCALAFEFHASVLDHDANPVAPTPPPADATNSFVILAGDGLLTEAYTILSGLSDDVRQVVSDVAAQHCIAWLELVRLSEARRLTPDLYLSMVSQTTGALFGLSARLGAMMAGQKTEATLCAERIGRATGVATSLLVDIQNMKKDPTPDHSHPFAFRTGKRPRPFPLIWSDAHDADVAGAFDTENPNISRHLNRLRVGGAMTAARTEARAQLDLAQRETAQLDPAVDIGPLTGLTTYLHTQLESVVGGAERKAS